MLFSSTIFSITDKDSSCYILTSQFVDESYTINSLNLVQKIQKFNHLQNFITLSPLIEICEKKIKKLCFLNWTLMFSQLKLNWTLIIDKWLFSKLLFRRKALILKVVGFVFSFIPSRISNSKNLFLNSWLLPYLALLLLTAT